MDTTERRRRTALHFPRVEFDLSALILGMGGYLLYWAVWGPLAGVLAIADRLQLPTDVRLDTTSAGALLQREFWAHVLARLELPFLDRLAGLAGWKQTVAVQLVEGKPGARQASLDVPYLELPWWHFAVVAAVLLVVWSLVSAALSRVHAVRIARDRSIGPVGGLEFALGQLPAYVLAPLFVLGAAVLFGGGTALLGALVAVPWAGPVLQLVAHPLALVSGVVFTIVALGLVFGLPLTHAALATERNGYLDAVSRTFSYAFTRPLPFVFGFAVVLFVGDLLSRIGTWFVARTSELLYLGAGWSDGAREAVQAGVQSGLALSWPDGEFGGALLGTAIVTSLCTSLALLAVKGLVLSYVVGGLTDVYFQLRGEVDGIEDREVYLDEDELSFGEPLGSEPAATD